MTDAVTSARLVRLLQLQLEARGRARADGIRAKARGPAAPSHELRDIIRRSVGDERARDDLRRAVIEHLLVDRLGSGLRSEPKFQQMLDRIRLMIAERKEWQRLLDQTIEDLAADSA